MLKLSHVQRQAFTFYSDGRFKSGTHIITEMKVLFLPFRQITRQIQRANDGCYLDGIR